MFGIIRRHVIRQKFKKLVRIYDDQIADARAKHLPVAHLQKAKTEFVHKLLGSSRDSARPTSAARVIRAATGPQVRP